MRLCTVRGADILLDPLLLVAVAAACVLGRLNDLLEAMLALTLHEAAHAAAAHIFGCRIRAFVLAPHGAALLLGDASLSPHTEWCVAAAGPLCSFLTAGAAASVVCLFPVVGGRMRSFLVFSLLLGLVNLLPALPLDGGRIAKCALERRLSPRAAATVTAAAGVVAGAALLSLAVAAALSGVYNLTLPVMGLFLTVNAVRELRATPLRRVRAVMRRNEALRGGGAADIRLVAASRSMRGSEALRLLRGGSLLVLRVVDERMQPLGELSETDVVLGIAALGPEASVGALLARKYPVE